MKDADKYVRQSALNKLVNTEKVVPGSLVPYLIPLLHDPDRLNRLYAAEALGKAGRAGKPATGPLIESMNVDDPIGSNLCQDAIHSLIAIAPDDPTVLRAIDAKMKQNKPFIAEECARALAKAGKPGVPYLVAALNSDNRFAIFGAAGALGTLGREGKDAIPSLLRLIKDRHLLTVQYSCGGGDSIGVVLYALASISPDDKNVVETIIAVSKEKDFRARYGAIEALKKIGSQQALDAAALAKKSLK